MQYKTSDIRHESGKNFVLQIGPGHFEVYRGGTTAATRHGIFHNRANPEWAMLRAIAHCNSLETHA